jgi:hypothetical protein
MDVSPALAGDRWLLNHTVYTPGQQIGHYECFYERANHPAPARLLDPVHDLCAGR